MIPGAYCERYGVDEADLRVVLSRIAQKNHANGAKNPKAQYQREVSLEQILDSPTVAGCLRVLDCSGVSDGAAAAIVCRAEDAHKYTDSPLLVKAMSLVVGPGDGMMQQDYDFTTFPEVAASAREAYRQAGIEDPREEVNLAEVHDCFTPTELLLMEDLGFSQRGSAWRDVLEGRFELGGAQPVNRVAGAMQPHSARRSPQRSAYGEPPAGDTTASHSVQGYGHSPHPTRGSGEERGSHRQPSPPRGSPRPRDLGASGLRVDIRGSSLRPEPTHVSTGPG